MDVYDYWQENKRFLTTVGVGVLSFFIGRAVIQSVYGDALSRQRRSITRAKSELGEARFKGSQLSDALSDNDELREVVELLEDASRFEARETFQLDPTQGSPSNQYFEAVSSLRASLMRDARRSDLRLPEELGLPALSPTRKVKIVRYLEALDVVERVARLAIEASLERIEKIDIQLDPALDSRRGVGQLEKTKVKFRLGGNTLSIARVIAMTQDSSRGKPLVIDELEMRPQRNKSAEARADLTIAVPRLHVSTEEVAP